LTIKSKEESSDLVRAHASKPYSKHTYIRLYEYIDDNLHCSIAILQLASSLMMLIVVLHIIFMNKIFSDENI